MGYWITDGKTKLGCYMFPDRKKPAICITECDTNVIDVYGYLKDEEIANLFIDKLAELVNAKSVE